MAPTDPACWSEMTRRTPANPRRLSARKKSRQKASPSESPISRPKISRRPQSPRRRRPRPWRSPDDRLALSRGTSTDSNQEHPHRRRVPCSVNLCGVFAQGQFVRFNGSRMRNFRTPKSADDDSRLSRWQREIFSDWETDAGSRDSQVILAMFRQAQWSNTHWGKWSKLVTVPYCVESENLNWTVVTGLSDCSNSTKVIVPSAERRR